MKICEQCRENRHYVLDFHHKNKHEKICEISVMVFQRNLSIKKIMAEIEKCSVLCANCHREKHYFERRDLITEVKND